MFWKFLSDRRGEVVPWLIIVPLVFFIFFFGAVYLQFDQVRAGVAMAAREGARECGVQLGRTNDPGLSFILGKERARRVLESEGLLPPGGELLSPGQVPPEGRRGASVELRDDGWWVRCTVTYYWPSPLPGLPRILYGVARPEEGPWWRTSGHFVFQVAGAAKREYHYERRG